MDYNKSTLFDKRASSSNKLIQYKFSNNNVNKDKRRSDEIDPIIFSNRFKEVDNSKINQIPKNHRLSVQNSNMFLFSKISKNPDNKNYHGKPRKKDKNYYINLLNELYLNDTHLTNKKKIMKFEKENPNKFSKYNSSKNISFKFSTKNSNNKKNSIFSNEYRNKSHKKLNIFNNIKPKEEMISKDTANFTHETRNKRINKKYLSTKMVSKFKTSKDKKLKKNKSSFNDNDIEKEENLNDTLKDEKNNEAINKEIKSKKKICKFSNKKNKSDNKINEKEETEVDVGDNNENISNKKTDTNKKFRKLRKCWFFCCLTANDKDDSYSDNI